MIILFLVLVVLASVLLGIIVLIQNPKGGGLSGTFGGFGNQIMGVKQTNDVLEKGTWIFAGVIAILCLTSTLFISGSAGTTNDRLEKINPAGAGQRPPAGNTVPFTNPQPATPAPDTNK